MSKQIIFSAVFSALLFQLFSADANACWSKPMYYMGTETPVKRKPPTRTEIVGSNLFDYSDVRGNPLYAEELSGETLSTNDRLLIKIGYKYDQRRYNKVTLSDTDIHTMVARVIGCASFKEVQTVENRKKKIKHLKSRKADRTIRDAMSATGGKGGNFILSVLRVTGGFENLSVETLSSLIYLLNHECHLIDTDKKEKFPVINQRLTSVHRHLYRLYKEAVSKGQKFKADVSNRDNREVAFFKKYMLLVEKFESGGEKKLGTSDLYIPIRVLSDTRSFITSDRLLKAKNFCPLEIQKLYPRAEGFTFVSENDYQSYQDLFWDKSNLLMKKLNEQLKLLGNLLEEEDEQFFEEDIGDRGRSFSLCSTIEKTSGHKYELRADKMVKEKSAKKAKKEERKESRGEKQRAFEEQDAYLEWVNSLIQQEIEKNSFANADDNNNNAASYPRQVQTDKEKTEYDTLKGIVTSSKNISEMIKKLIVEDYNIKALNLEKLNTEKGGAAYSIRFMNTQYRIVIYPDPRNKNGFLQFLFTDHYKK